MYHVWDKKCILMEVAVYCFSCVEKAVTFLERTTSVPTLIILPESEKELVNQCEVDGIKPFKIELDNVYKEVYIDLVCGWSNESWDNTRIEMATLLEVQIIELDEWCQGTGNN